MPIRLRRVLATALVFTVAHAVARTEQLPAALYTVENGLAHNSVQQVLVDSKGFVWFATASGVSRFDGRRFVSYGRENGLPDPFVNGVIEDSQRRIWVATNGGGAARFNPTGAISESGQRRVFVRYPVGSEPDSNRVNKLLETRSGDLLAATDAGLYRLSARSPGQGFKQVQLGVANRPDRLIRVFAIVEDAVGLWLGTTAGVLRRLHSGALVAYAPIPPAAASTVSALIVDRQGLVWSGSSSGVAVFRPTDDGMLPDTLNPRTIRPAPGDCVVSGGGVSVRLDEPGTGCLLGHDFPFSSTDVRSLHEGRDGRILIGTLAAGAWQFDRRRLHPITTRFEGFSVSSMTEDETGNLWAAGRLGALRITRSGLALFRKADGLPPGPLVALGEDRGGVLYALRVGWQLDWFDGERFHRVRFNVPPGTARSSWPELRQLLDHNGEWWVGTGEGLYRFPRTHAFGDIARLPPVAIYRTRDGLPNDDIVQLFEDSHGDVWVATGLGSSNSLCKWDRRTNRFHAFSEAEGIPAFNQPLQFAEDRAGGVWIGFREGGLARYYDGRFTFLWREGPAHRLYVDRRGSLWVSDFRVGTVRIDNPEGAAPTLTWYSREKGLSTDSVIAYAEDSLGHLYLATDRAIDRFDPESGNIRHLTSGDGLPAGGATVAFADRLGQVWFGSFEGLTRLTTAPEAAPVAPRVRIGGVRVDGHPYPVSEDGERDVVRIALPAGQNSIEIDVFALSPRIGETYRYQFQLVGADADWGPLTEQSTVHYARLAPGRYQFLARAVSAAGLVSDAAASVALEIEPPFWRRWWFLAITGLMLGAGTYGVYQYRLRQMLRVERVRARIAGELHDDIGSGLSQIAILSEVARQRLDDGDGAGQRLSYIAETSRQLVDAMGDIVWAIDPHRDSLGDLTHRMRRFAADTLDGRDIRLAFDGPDTRQQARLGADVRREVYLILKESVTNIARHSGCASASIRFALEPDRLLLSIADDGRGFSPESPADGNGLANMRRRVRALGGQLQIDSAPGRGTVVQLEVSLKGRASLA